MKLLKIRTFGLKNLKNPVELSFCNNIIEDKVKFNSSIKAIYGSNGSGKSAIMGSVDLYKSIISTSNYLLKDSNQEHLKKLINYQTKKFSFELIFSDCMFQKSKDSIFKHELTIEFNELTQNYEITHESLGAQKGRNINDFEPLIAVNKQNLEVFSFNKDLSNKFFETFLKRRIGLESILFYSFETIFSNELNPSNIFEREPLTELMFGTIVSILNLSVFMLDSDRHEQFELAKKISKYYEKLKNNENVSLDNIKQSFKIDKYNELVEINSFGNYKKRNALLENFIKVFKPNLIKINLNERRENNVYHCRKSFIYDDGEVDIEYESSGIKQLVKLFNNLYAFYKGAVVFIDELDVNINSIYLKKLIEFLIGRAKGQLILTTHNLDLMEALRKEKAGIYALGFDNQLDIWSISGNANPKNYYVDGYFAHSPNNVENFDFLAAFEE